MPQRRRVTATPGAGPALPLQGALLRPLPHGVPHRAGGDLHPNPDRRRHEGARETGPARLGRVQFDLSAPGRARGDRSPRLPALTRSGVSPRWRQQYVGGPHDVRVRWIVGPGDDHDAHAGRRRGARLVESSTAACHCVDAESPGRLQIDVGGRLPRATSLTTTSAKASLRPARSAASMTASGDDDATARGQRVPSAERRRPLRQQRQLLGVALDQGARHVVENRLGGIATPSSRCM